MAITVRDLTGVRTENVSLSTDLAMRLKEDILSGRLRQDQKLTEQAICRDYSVSRTPVREALISLESEGLVTIIPNRGAFVAGFSARDLDDIYVLRKIYEVQAVRWAAERITDEQLENLEETFEFMEFYTMKKDTEKMLNINVNFHKSIYQAAGNRMLQQLLSSYQIYIKYAGKNRRNDEASGDPDYLSIVLEEHRDIFNAIVAHDPDKAASAMTRHMDNSIARHRK